MREKCRDPCPGSCGLGSQCNVINHLPICTCPVGYTGDPFVSCYIKPSPRKFKITFQSSNIHVNKYIFEYLAPKPQYSDPCNPSPCGPSATCNNGICSCIPGYQGDPYRGCRPECVLNEDCAKDKACVKNKCVNPCIGTCGNNAICEVYNHIPMCHCPPGMTGNAFITCHQMLQEQVIRNPCSPSPCGPNSQCREVNNQAICTCLPSFFGYPPNCRPECTVNSDCSMNMACLNQRCRDPCPGTCGINAECQVINHNAICSCPLHLSGDPFSKCSYPGK